MAVTKRAGRNKKDAGAGGGASKVPFRGAASSAGGAGNVKKAFYEGSKKKEVGVSDLTLISKISNEAINENLMKRFEAAEIYTYIGHVLISVNPFRDLGIYVDSVMESYKGKNRLEMPPHVFAIGEASYYNMNAYRDNQCIIISGESGAGKTEAAKRIMQYIANVSGGSQNSHITEIKNMVLATNPLLEAFGCAKTLRNNNSSRHGKYLEIQFNAQGEPCGANITNYLLEKARVVGQITNERNFHIFYQFAKAANQGYRELFGIQEPSAYEYTSKSRCLEVPGIDDTKEFSETLEAMRVIGLTQQEQDDIFRLLAVILWLGNVQFREDDSGNAEITDPGVTDFAAYLLQVDGAALHKALSIRIVETSRGGRRGSIYESPLNPVQANAVRDALAKAIYNNLFEWIVDRINVSMKAREQTSYTIGILDIYGFEIFDKNSFEQLCINYVNEKLQQIFIELTLKTEQEEYVREQIEWQPIKYFNNKIVCDLIEEKRPPGVFAALNDACATAHADSSAADGTFIQRLNALSTNPHFQQRQTQFIIKHYAGDVTYQIEHMTDKNKDQLLRDILELIEGSDNQFLHVIFPQQVSTDNKGRRPPTASDKIKASANDLVNTLSKATPSYIRTIKPNQNKSPKEYDTAAVLHQIKYLGLQENVRIRRAGFAYRQTFERFVDRFYLLSPKTSYAGDYIWTGDPRSGCEQILRDTRIPKEEWQMGTTKAFIKTPETLFALETMRDRYWHNMAIRIQRAWRNYLRYRTECAIRIQRWWRNLTGSTDFIKLRDYGHTVLGGRKERRRFSLLGSRRFMGDYLGIDNRGGYGEHVRNSVQIPASDRTIFSCRGEMLVSKLGRSSKPNPRLLVLTNRNFYIISQNIVNNNLQIVAERAVPLGTIKFIGMSNLRDDWFSLGIGAPQAPDPLLSCVFKTELVTHMKGLMPGIFDLRIGPTIEYNKKPGKIAVVKTMKDPAVPRDDLYKSGTIHVGPGESPSSQSRPTPKPRAKPAKAITSGGLLKKSVNGKLSSQARGGGGRATPQPQPRPVPQPQQLPGGGGSSMISNTHPVIPVAAAVPQPPPQPQQVSMLNGSAGHQRTPSSSTPAAARAPPPPPPPPVAPPSQDPIYRVLYDFAGQSENELSLTKGEIIIIVQKEGNGWWLAKKQDETQGWAPSAYLKEEEAPKPAPPPPPPPPAQFAGKAKPPPPPRPNKTSAAAAAAARRPSPMQHANEAATPPTVRGSGLSTETASSNSSLAGGLAAALKRREQANRGPDGDDDDW
ncbi:class II myosin [Orbilia brochopaga]|uniref:Myosin-1 n=1 Tax=Orbilia brochopaga TaxID=3140254 RepID=A0AAV9U0P4_9PEZI